MASGPGSGGPEDPRFYEALGRAIKVVRAQRGLSRGRLAELADLSYPYLSEVENGKKRPSSKALLQLADALALPASELLGIAEGIARLELAPEGASEPLRADDQAASSMSALHSAPTALPTAMATAAPRDVRASGLGKLGTHEQARPAAEAPPQQGIPRQGAVIDDASARQALVRLIRAVDRLSPEDIERLADLAERLAAP
jgi:transcriptional regulator with XRE-family HTH domain